MKSKSYKSTFILVIFTIVLGGCDFYYKNMPFVSVPPQTISGPVTIDSNWVEIIPPEPLRVVAHDPWITLGYLEYSNNGFSDRETEDSLNLADGRKTKIEGFLFDDKGESYELQLFGVGSGIQIGRKMKIEIVNGKSKNIVLNFPSDRTYTKLRIRSEIPLACDKIEWINAKAW